MITNNIKVVCGIIISAVHCSTFLSLKCLTHFPILLLWYFCCQELCERVVL